VGTVPAPVKGSSLTNVVVAYLKIGRGLADDKIDATAVNESKSAAESLSGDKYSELRETISQTAAATDVNSARIAFKRESEVLMSLLKMAPSK
jgi:hypothetical protein